MIELTEEELQIIDESNRERIDATREYRKKYLPLQCPLCGKRTATLTSGTQSCWACSRYIDGL